MSEGSTDLGTVLLFDVLLIAGGIFGAACFAETFPVLAACFVLFFWPAGLYLDLSSTLEIYRMDPEGFFRNEMNKPLAGLVTRFGPVWGPFTYVVLWEVPFFVLVSLFLLWFLAPYFSLMLGLASRLGGAAVGMGVTHLTGWYLNEKYLESRKKAS